MSSLIESSKDIIKRCKKDINDCINQFTYGILHLFKDLPRLYNKLSLIAFEGKIESNSLRPIFWKIALGILPMDLISSLEDWVHITNAKRKQYQTKKNQIKNKKLSSGNPLESNNVNSEWSSFFKDQELSKIIALDINRTLQDNELFCIEYTKTMLSNILLIWSKDNSHVSYKQGMNEILALLFYSLFPYYIDNDVTLSNEAMRNNAEKYAKEVYYFFHNEKYIEADLYCLFNEIMQGGISSLYEINASVTKTNKLFKAPFDYKEKSIANIINRGNRILKDILKVFDEELFAYLVKKDIDFTTVLQRWLKCMFSREFHPLDTSILWDAIFAQERDDLSKGIANQFEFIDYISSAMIIYIKDDCKHMIVYDKDDNDILRRIFKYPPIESVLTLVKLAEKIKRRITSIHQVNKKVLKEINESKGIDNANGKSKGNEENVKKTPFQNNYEIIPLSMTDYLLSTKPKDMDLVYQITTKITNQKKTLLDKLDQFKDKYISDKQSDDYLDFDFVLQQLKAKMV